MQDQDHAPGKPPMQWLPSANHDARPGGPRDIDAIVLHHTGGGTLESNVAWLASPESRLSAHYVIGKDGTVVHAVRDEDRAWHAGVSRLGDRDRVNDFSIGIEIVNDGDNVDPYPPAQMEALARLVAWLVQAHGIGLDRIIGHRYVALPEGRKVDPSDNFDREGLDARIREILGPTPSRRGPAPGS